MITQKLHLWNPDPHNDTQKHTAHTTNTLTHKHTHQPLNVQHYDMYNRQTALDPLTIRGTARQQVDRKSFTGCLFHSPNGSSAPDRSMAEEWWQSVERTEWLGVVQQPLACRLSIPAVLTEARVGAICHPDQSWNSACLLRESRSGSRIQTLNCRVGPSPSVTRCMRTCTSWKFISNKS